MSHDPIDDFLKLFDELTVEQRGQLINELENRQIAHTNGGTKPRSLLDAFQERGLVGSIKGAPADWSTNPDYLRGFGKTTDAQ